MGRPPLADDGSVQRAIRFPSEMAAEIAAISDARLDKPPFSSVVRELIAEALDARSRKAGK